VCGKAIGKLVELKDGKEKQVEITTNIYLQIQIPIMTEITTPKKFV
jgi:hypothetical protein